MKLAEKNAGWSAIKRKIISYYSDTEDRDTNLKKLTTLNFVESKRLREFVEDLVYSFEKAFPFVLDDESKIRFVKSKIPPSIESELVRINEYNNGKTLEDFMKGIRQFDKLKLGGRIKEEGEKVTRSELVDLIKKISEGIKQEGEATRSILAAFRPRSREPSPWESNRQRERSPYRPSRNVSPFNLRDQDTNQPTYRSLPNGNLSRNYDIQSTNQGPTNYHVERRKQRTPPPMINEPVHKRPLETDQKTPSTPKGVFSDEAYFAKYGKPNGPCMKCGYMHWMRHCLNHLN